jgi:hypothetical protein
VSTMSSLELRTKTTSEARLEQRLRDRVTNELTTTFASHCSSAIWCGDTAHAESGNFISKFWPVRSVPVEVHNFCSEGVRA